MNVRDAIGQQLQTNVRDGFVGPSTIEVDINGRWEILPCEYRDGVFTVTRGKEILSFTIYVELTREARTVT